MLRKPADTRKPGNQIKNFFLRGFRSRKDPMIQATPGVLQDVDPRDWKRHRYGVSPERWNDLKGRSFWITGAGTGFGRSIAIGLASAGAQVFLTGRRREKLAESLEEMRSLGVSSESCRILALDITDPDQVIEGCRYVQGQCAFLCGLVNNAAISQRTESRWPLQEGSLDFWDRIFRLNVTAHWQVTNSILPHMVKGGEVKALFITSEAGWAFTPGFGQYNITKAALNSLGACMAEECAARYPNLDVQMNVLDPGEARTEMNQGSNTSPYTIVSMALTLLSHPRGGPNGKFFHRDGRHLSFAYALPYDRLLIGEK